MALVPLFGLGQKGKSAVVTAQRHLNLYCEVNPQGDKGPVTFYGTPGLLLFTSFGDTPIRGMIVVGDFIYVVHRGTFWKLNNAGVKTSLGTLQTTSGRVSMTYNGVQIAITDGTAYYIYIIGQTAQTITSITNSGTTATLTTSSSHLRYTGETVTVSGATPAAYNGTFVITVTGANTFTYTMLSNPVASAAISTITFVGTTATMTTATAHGLVTGNVITVSGATPSAYNGTFTVTVTGTTTLTYTMLTTPATNATVVGSYMAVTTPATVVGSYAVVASFLTSSVNLVGTPIDITFGDSYGILGYADGKFQITASYDFTTQDALDYATAESNPDGLVRLIYDHGELVLFGEQTTEFWSNTGGQDFPYSNQRGSTLQFGLAAKWSLVQYNDSIAGLFKNSMGQVQVMMMRGHAIVPISTPEIDSIINGYATVSDATAFGYMLGGHPMLEINFPSENASWLYDGSTQMWSPLESGLNGDRHRAEMLVDFLNKPQVSDYSNGNIYTLDPDTYTDNGTPIPREIITKTIFAGANKRIAVHRIDVDCETGNGLVSGQGADPQIMLRVSKDSGRTWGNELWACMGKIGEFVRRAYWTRLGSAYFWTFKWRITDPVKVVLTFTDADSEVRN